MMDLAANSPGKAIPLREVAERQAISEKYLWQVVALLKGAGLVESVRGARGGYRLSRPAAAITVREIVEGLEGGIEVVDCSREPAGGCPRSFDCVARELWASLGDTLRRAMDAVTLKELAGRERQRRHNEPLTYEI